MNREFLKGLGLDDAAIDKIMAEHGKTVNATKQELETVKTDRDELKTQLTDRDTQLDELKKIDHEGLKSKIAELETTNATTATEYQGKLDKQSFDFALEKALNTAGVKNAKAVKALLDSESIKLDGDKLLNLDSQLETLKASDAYLFQEETPPPNTPSITAPGNPNGGITNALTKESFNEMSYKERVQIKKDNPQTYDSLTGN